MTSIYLEHNLTERTSFVEIETQDPKYGTLATRGPVTPYELPLRPRTKAFPPNRLLYIEGWEIVKEMAHQVAVGIRQVEWGPVKATLKEAMDMIDITVDCNELHMCTNESTHTHPVKITQNRARSSLDTLWMYVKVMECRTLPGSLSNTWERLTHTSLVIGLFVKRPVDHTNAILEGGASGGCCKLMAYTDHGNGLCAVGGAFWDYGGRWFVACAFWHLFHHGALRGTGRRRGSDPLRLIRGHRSCPTSMRTPPQDLMSKRMGLGLCSMPRLRPSLVRQVPTTKDCSMGVPSAGPLPPRRARWPGASSPLDPT